MSISWRAIAPTYIFVVCLEDGFELPQCLPSWLDLTRFNKIAIQGTPRMAVENEARAYRESINIVIISVTSPYTKCNLP